MAHHKEFETAGKKPGLQVWRVEKMDLKPVPPQLHGEFFTGDAYVLLYTTPAPSYNVHTWIGNEASQDERGSAAIYMTQLDDFLRGAPRQYSEFQNQESLTFLGYFKSGIKYKKGGVASGFHHVVTNEVNVKRLLHVKGRRMIRATEVDFSWASFNKGDCFIIDLGKDIYHWSGSESSRYERLKTSELAIDIRDNERKGRAEIHMIEEGSEPEGVINVSFFLYLYTQMVLLGKSRTVFHELGWILVADKNPFKQSMLSQSDCYILDNGGDNKIFVWKGRDANENERKAAMAAANRFIKEKNYPQNTQVQVLPAGAESTLFKQFFFNWLDKDESTGPTQAYTIGRIAKVKPIPFDASTLHGNNAMAAQHAMVDDGSGKVQIWRIEKGDKVPVEPSSYGQFFGGDCYLVLYSYNAGGREKHIIYTWQGKKCTQDELTASAFLTVKLDDSMGGVATQVRVTQGQEPPHLVSLFKNKPIVIHQGGTSRKGGESKPGKVRLFHIRQSSTKATRAVEVDPTASSLNTNDVFVLKTSDSQFLWKGKGATAEEVAAAKYVAGLLGGTATEVEETKEPAGFWAALGGKKDYQTSKTLQRIVKPPRLFGLSNKTGRLIVKEVPGEFTQMDLATDDVMILDTGDQIFVWIGNEANEAEKTGSSKIGKTNRIIRYEEKYIRDFVHICILVFFSAQDYVNSDPSGRRGIPINTVKQGAEPPSFSGWFHAWDVTMWDKDPSQFMLERIKKQ
uniref:Scinderin like a n=1 Tax=Mastacembelus armatus TaxID=205130 RepID=A0A7N8WTL7_9TELE